MEARTKTGKRLLGAMAVAGATTALLVSASAAAPAHTYGEGDLQDLQPGTSQPTDGASALVQVMEAEGRTTVVVHLEGLDASLAGTTLGAHIHVGPCVAGDGGAALGHYNTGDGISEETEVWLDFEIMNNGKAVATTSVPFTIAAGDAQSMVIHANPTDPQGGAGPRLACLPVEF